MYSGRITDVRTKRKNQEDDLLQVLETSLQELSHPLRTARCWSNLLLSELEPHSPMDLEIIVAEAERINEIVRGLNLLAKNGGIQRKNNLLFLN